jgi:serine/threonine protein kinase
MASISVEDKNDYGIPTELRFKGDLYRVTNEVLGKGSFGIVIAMCRNEEIKKNFAVKCFGRLDEDDYFAERNYLLKTSGCPFIVPLVGCDNVYKVLVFPRAYGDLRMVMENENMYKAHIDTLESSIAAAVHWIHLCNLKHCDIKMSNILLSQEGVWWLGDLGAMRSHYSLDDNQPFTPGYGDEFFFTPNWADRLEKESKLLYAADWFAFGCTMVMSRFSIACTLFYVEFDEKAHNELSIDNWTAPFVKKNGINVSRLGAADRFFRFCVRGVRFIVRHETTKDQRHSIREEILAAMPNNIDWADEFDTNVLPDVFNRVDCADLADVQQLFTYLYQSAVLIICGSKFSVVQYDYLVRIYMAFRINYLLIEPSMVRNYLAGTIDQRLHI